MDRIQLTRYNVCQNLDDLMNLDPRGYGVCRILYAGSRHFTGKPLVLNAAEKLTAHIKKGSIVHIITGFVLLPHRKAEMDGICSSMMLARFIAETFEALPVLVIPEDCKAAVKELAPVVGLHLYDNIAEAGQYPAAIAFSVFTKDSQKATEEAECLLAQGKPSMVISVEASGANAKGEYHNAVGMNLTELEAKSDRLFEIAQQQGIPTLSVGDLGNEVGMGTIADHIRRFIPRAAEGTCQCDCAGGLLAVTAADAIITATVSDWGVYAMMAATAFLLDRPELLPGEQMQRNVIRTASRCGMVDMYGWLNPAIDGMDEEFNMTLLNLMRRCIHYPATVKDRCGNWFEGVKKLGFFDQKDDLC